MTPPVSPTEEQAARFVREYGPVLTRVMAPVAAAMAVWVVPSAEQRPMVAITIVAFFAFQASLDRVLRADVPELTRYALRGVVNFLAITIITWGTGVGGPAWLMAIPMVTGAAFADSVRRAVIVGAAPILGFLLGSALIGNTPHTVLTGLLALGAMLLIMSRVIGHLRNSVYTSRQQRSEIERVNAELEAALAARKTFLATMSHEIRTPMNGIIGMAELLDVSQLTDDQGRMVDVIRSSGTSLLQILNDILDLSKLEAGRMTAESVPFRPRVVVDDVVELMRHGDLAADVTLGTAFDDVPDVLEGDPGRFRQVLLNLVGNAVKFTREGSITVSVSWDRGTLSCAVADTGPGIAPSARARLFQPFVQVDGSHDRTHGGTGLGLAISRRLVDLMGGALTVESHLGAGSTFRFTVQAPAPETTEERAVAPGAALDGAGFESRVLVVDDNPVNLTVARVMLERLGCRVTAVDSGQAALDAWAERPFDLVFMDVQMPEMDGLEATRRLLAVGAGAPVVALTAGVTDAERKQCEDAGMEGVLAKPVTLRTMRGALVRWGASVVSAR